MKKLIAGNWKMNGSLESGEELVSAIASQLHDNPAVLDICDFLVCPPSLYMLHLADACQSSDILCGAQDCSEHEAGAYTGNVSAAMVADCGGTYVILGHSERRQYHGESSELVAAKAAAAHSAGLTAIICIGESEAEREAGIEQEIVGEQLSASLPAGATSENTVIAYEPVWAIGTGKTASGEDVAAMHSFIRGELEGKVDGFDGVRILYGGSMKPENAAELLTTPNVDGGLIGGASLKVEQFVEIALAALVN